MPRYFISIGSNIAPYDNVPKILQALLEIASPLQVSRIIENAPVGMKSTNMFLNLTLALDSPLEATEIKDRFNAIEVQLGRDKTDPNRKKKDRPADIDIMYWVDEDVQVIPTELLPEESYNRPSLLELLDYMGLSAKATLPLLPTGAEIEINGQKIGTQPSTLNKA
ncbi:MAG: 2-amino-4-hydroxy-6-hydroxymethyldihydropteridine diphosphokinase [Chloroflexi bacterium]|nr:MAG: 2-amino-4-hydroxy-6-hydroxymethyldihydropteridine diphosphokinase [Chloroflexota bacterium]MBL1193042.1 2-amino-4-hydroxy-6-hydroxymethyldihydropteridine diphosphokinase [Chloroflexota bacterium]NOH10335.1 2-amino-4-hydroxy-6-hydroxymethyldihydropteridine diphosphokinase [Chloroflexota bacterium]